MSKGAGWLLWAAAAWAVLTAIIFGLGFLGQLLEKAFK